MLFKNFINLIWKTWNWHLMEAYPVPNPSDKIAAGLKEETKKKIRELRLMATCEHLGADLNYRSAAGVSAQYGNAHRADMLFKLADELERGLLYAAR